jgi:hypothetical protein
VVLSYLEASASYFFTTLFDTSSEAESPYPQFRRGLLTANMAPNGGMIKFGYTTDNDSSSTFNFSNYTEITPNTVFELPSPSQYLRFGILFVSVMSDEAPATLYPVADCVVATTAALPSTAAIIYANGACWSRRATSSRQILLVTHPLSGSSIRIRRGYLSLFVHPAFGEHSTL